MGTVEVGELLYDFTLRLVGMTEYGISLKSIREGASLPPAGARFDFKFTGASNGPKIKGAVTGVDYLRIRADGRIQVHVHGEINTDDGQNIALYADGVLRRREGSGILDIRENVTLSTSSQDYIWVNALQIWAIGTVDFAEQILKLKGYVV